MEDQGRVARGKRQSQHRSEAHAQHQKRHLQRVPRRALEFQIRAFCSLLSNRKGKKTNSNVDVEEKKGREIKLKRTLTPGAKAPSMTASAEETRPFADGSASIVGIFGSSILSFWWGRDEEGARALRLRERERAIRRL